MPWRKKLTTCVRFRVKLWCEVPACILHGGCCFPTRRMAEGDVPGAAAPALHGPSALRPAASMYKQPTGSIISGHTQDTRSSSCLHDGDDGAEQRSLRPFPNKVFDFMVWNGFRNLKRG